MGFNIGDLWGNAKDAAEDAWKDAVKVGVPALEQAAIDWAQDVLGDQEKKTSAALQTGVSEILNRPTDDNSFGTYISSALQSPILKNYGPLIIFGVIGVGIAGYMVMRKG